MNLPNFNTMVYVLALFTIKMGPQDFDTKVYNEADLPHIVHNQNVLQVCASVN